jgi:hypothetical protein
MRPIIAPFLALVACMLSATGAAAQHCWPTMVALVLRDEGGAVIHPRDAEISYLPDGRDARFRVVVAEIDETDAGPVATAADSALTWWGSGPCRIDIDTVVVRRGDREMRLLPNVHLRSLEHPGPSEYVLDTPPFAPGTWALGPLPPGVLGRPKLVPAAAWRPVVVGGP